MIAEKEDKNPKAKAKKPKKTSTVTTVKSSSAVPEPSTSRDGGILRVLKEIQVDQISYDRKVDSMDRLRALSEYNNEPQYEDNNVH